MKYLLICVTYTRLALLEYLPSRLDDKKKNWKLHKSLDVPKMIKIDCTGADFSKALTRFAPRKP